MYLLYYGFSQEPFHTTPDPEFLYLSPSHKEAIASIIYGVERRKGFIAVVGEVGVGKTTVLRSFMEKIDPEREKAIYLLNPRLTFTSLLKNILEEFGEETKDLQDDEMVRILHEHLIEEYKQDRTVILIIDEAQNVPIQTLEQLRMLSNLETSMDKLLQIILIGQPELDGILRRHELRQLRQRIAIRSTIRPLSEKESLAYILHRLERVLIKEAQVFSKGALKLVIDQAGGIPRRINIICDNALITGFGAQQNPVTAHIVKEVIADIDGESRAPKMVPWVPITVGLATILVFLIGWLVLFNGNSTSGNLFGMKSRFFMQDKEVQMTSAHSSPATGGNTSGDMRNPVETRIFRQKEDIPSLPSGVENTLNKTGSLLPQEERKGNLSGLNPALESFPTEDGPPVTTMVKGEGQEPFKKIVKKGDTLSRLIEKVYGASSPTRVERVMKDNPHIRNPRKIFPGQEVVFPELDAEGHN